MKVKEILSESWAVSWPMALIMLFEFLIGLSDVYIAGMFGKDVQAAYGLAFQLYFVFIFIGIALSIGSVSVISRLFTSEKKDELNLAIGSSISASVAAGLLFTTLGVLFSRAIITSFNIPDALKNSAASLLMIYSVGFVFDYVLITANGILRASNMIKKSLLTMTVVCILNIGLNFFLSFRTPLGFNGLAVATVISLSIGSLLSLFYTRKITAIFFRFSLPVIKKIVGISWPAGLLQIFWQLGAMVLFLILAELPSHSIEIMAAFTNGIKVESAIFLPAFAFNMANAVVVGNLLGKGEKDNAFKGGILTAGLGVAIVSVLTLLVMLNARRIASFLSPDALVVGESIRYIYIALISEPFMAWAVILGGGLNGAGDTKSVMAIVSLSIWLVRLPLCYLLGVLFGMGPVAIWWSMNISIFVHTAFISVRYFRKRWIVYA